MSMRQIAAGFVILSATWAVAQTHEELGNALKACLGEQAVLYSSAICHAPSELMPVIYEKCHAQEQSIYDSVKSEDGANSANMVVDTMRKAMQGELLTSIVDTQIKRECR
jgi:hypothetical protein